MISAEAIPYKNYLRVVFIYPDLKSLEIKLPGTDPETLMGEARRLLYAENTKYILKKLRAWLKQRMYAFNTTDRARCSMDAAKLIILLGYYNNWSFFGICSLVAGNRRAFEALAPGETSAHYKIYRDNILPVLEFCTKLNDLKK